MTALWVERLRRATVVCCVFAFVGASLFWGTYALQRYQFSRNLDARAHATTGRAMLQNGLLLRFDKYVQPRIENALTDSRYLVIFTSDNCQTSRSQVPRWKSLLSTIAFRPADRVLIVTMDGVELPGQLEETLKSEGLAYQVLRVTNSAGFRRETGLSATPALLALDHEFRVRTIDYLRIPAVADEIPRFFREVG